MYVIHVQAVYGRFAGGIQPFKPYKPSILFVGHGQTMHYDPDQTPQNVGLHCLLTECSIKNLNKNEKYHL